MIERIQIKNYKALRDVTLNLTPIHVLIGPNDTGKTSILESIAALCRSVDQPLRNAFAGRWDGSSLVWKRAQESIVRINADLLFNNQRQTYELAIQFGAEGRQCRVLTDQVRSEANFLSFHMSWESRAQIASLGDGGGQISYPATAEFLRDALTPLLVCRWDARKLALPVAPDSKRQFALDADGFGLALLLDDILSYSRELFSDLEARFKKVFPQIKAIRLKREAAFRTNIDDPRSVPMLSEGDGKGIWLDIAGSEVPASQVSDGVLIVLAYLATAFAPKPPRVMLIEEPENGIHPKRLEKVVEILQSRVTEHPETQVILTTHSPYVLDFFKPEEVTLCRRAANGEVTVHRLSESKLVQEQARLFSLGEIWTGEGDDAIAGASPAKAEAER